MLKKSFDFMDSLRAVLKPGSAQCLVKPEVKHFQVPKEYVRSLGNRGVMCFVLAPFFDSLIERGQIERINHSLIERGQRQLEEGRVGADLGCPSPLLLWIPQNLLEQLLDAAAPPP